jgi:FkbM family methyltransferase
MRKVFIDLGSYKGDSIQEFFNWIQLIDDPKEYEIYAFEPNPVLENQSIINAKKNKYYFKPWAAWIYDGKIDMAIDGTKTPMGSTVMPSKVAIWDKFPHVRVECFNFSKWLADNFTPDDQVIIKMDIEGAEYPVLKKMIEEDTISLASYLFVEFHPNKVKDYTTTDTDELVNLIIEKGGNIKLWH